MAELRALSTKTAHCSGEFTRSAAGRRTRAALLELGSPCGVKAQ